MDGDRRGQLLALLRAASAPLSGEQLATALQVSSRTVRHYVRDLNTRAREDLVVAGHSGYRLDPAAYRRYRRGEAARRDRVDTPEQRQFFIARALVAHPEGTRVADLAERLSVSLDTVDSDLMRVRLLFRAHDLRVVREHDVLRVIGSEREQRRLVRQVLVDATEGFTPAALRAFERDYRDVNLAALRQYATAALDATRIEVSEYVLSDLLVHLAITADRVRAGHTIGAAEAPEEIDDPEVAAAVDHLAEAVHTALGVTLPEPERRVLAGVIATRANRRADGAETPFVRPEVLDLVREASRSVADYYLMSLVDERSLTRLALHVQGLVARARAGQALRNPLGTSFKAMHPLIHELALFFAHRIEEATGVHVVEGEVDYLSFHLGSQAQRQLEQGPRVTVTCAVPRYHDAHTDLADRLSAAVAGQAVVDEVVTTLDHDWASVRSDLIVSVVDVSGETAVPVVTVSPFLTTDDIDRVRDAIRAERVRSSRQRLRSNLLALVDPRLFHRVPSGGSRDEALAAMCERMAAEGFVEPGFLDDVLDRERRSSTAFGRQFAVPHSMYLDALRTGISVLVAERPIDWDGAEVRLVVLFSVSRDGRQVFRDVLDELIAVLGEPANVTALLAAADHTTFVRGLRRLLDG